MTKKKTAEEKAATKAAKLSATKVVKTELSPAETETKVVRPGRVKSFRF